MPQSIKAAVRSIAGLVLIGLVLVLLGGYFIYRGDELRRYDCYVWGFNHALCASGQTIVKGLPRYERCGAHLQPVAACADLPETQRGLADAGRYINGARVALPPGNRDYRTFHIWGK